MLTPSTSLRLIDLESIPKGTNAWAMILKIRDAGLEIRVLSVEHEFDLNYFEAYLIDPNLRNPVAICYGMGCHIDSDIALVRAISEATQSRLTYIHGGRDDIVDRVNHYRLHGRDQEIADMEALVESVSGIPFVPYRQRKYVGNIDEALAKAVQCAETRSGIGHLYWTQLSTADIRLRVVRVIVPGLEFCKTGFHRVGPRLANIFMAKRGIGG